MATSGELVRLIQLSKEWFDRSSQCLTEDDSAFQPTKEAMTSAQQVAHVAQTIDWFVEGTFRSEGFDVNFAEHAKKAQAVTSLKEARAWLDRAYAAAVKAFESRSEEELNEPIAPGLMGGTPRHAIAGSIADHTSHHRGVLTVYSRLLGKTPDMPYMDAAAMEAMMSQ